MTNRELLRILLQSTERLDDNVLVIDPFGTEVWKIDGVAAADGLVFIQVGERFDSEDEDHEEDPAAAFQAFIRAEDNDV